MIRLLVIAAATGYLVGFANINRDIPYFLLYTREENIEKDFVRAAGESPLQCSFLFCLDYAICNFTRQAKADYYSQAQTFSYTWQFSYESFRKFMDKMDSPIVISIQTEKALEKFKEFDMGFILFHNNQTDLDFFVKSIEKYQTTPLYFAEISENSLITHEKISELPMVRLYGLDGSMRFSSNNDVISFIELYKCPLLLPLTESEWAESCLQGKIAVVSFINKKRKGNWNVYAGQLKIYGEELREHGKFYYQMAYVDVKTYPKALEMYKIPIVPCVIIVDNRQFAEVYYLGEYNLKNKKKFFALIDSIAEQKLNLEEFTVEQIVFTKYFTVWQMFPLLFLLAGLGAICCFCIKSTFLTKEKVI